MKLLSIHIDNFGKLRDYDLNLTDGVNTILAENGYGKTTLAAFIKAMLYGFGQVSSRVKNLDQNERLHYTPWQGGAFGGYIDIETEKGRYRVSRSFGSKPAADTFTLISLDTKLESKDYSSNIGTELFGINADSYEKSTYFPQRDVALTMTSDITTKLTSLLESSNDLQELDSAVKLLENYSKTFKAYKGNGGLINDAQAKLNSTEECIDECKRAEKEITQYRAKLEKIKSSISDAEEKSAKLDRELLEISKLSDKYDEFKKLEEYRKDADEARKNFEAKKAYFKALPTNDDISSLERTNADIEIARATLCLKKARSYDEKKLEGYKKRFGDTPLTREYLESVNAKVTALHSAENELRMTQIPTEPEPPTMPGKSHKIFAPLACASAAIGAGLCFVNIFVGIALIAVSAVLLTVGVAATTKANSEEIRASESYEAKLEEYNSAKDKLNELTISINSLKSELDGIIAKYYPEHLGGYDSALSKLCDSTEEFCELINESSSKPDAQSTEELDAKIYSARLEFSKFVTLTSDDLAAELEDIKQRCRFITEAENDYKAKLGFALKYERERGLFGDAPDLPDKNAVQDELVRTKLLIAELNALYGGEKEKLERLEDTADTLTELIDEADRLRGDIEEYEQKRRDAENAKDFLSRASQNLSSRYLRKMEQSFTQNYEKASDRSIPNPNIDANLGISFRDGGAERGAEWYSEGIRSLITLCIRLALTDALFENEAPFITLDDPFSELDEVKLRRAKSLIRELGRNRQILYMTCHESRKIE